MHEKFLEVKELVKTYNQDRGILQLYNRLSFSLGRGDFLAVTGRSGWGKSTLANIVLGLESPSLGAIFHNDREVTRFGFNKRFSKTRLAIIFQRSTMLGELSVRKNLNLALSLSRVPKDEQSTRIDEALEFFGLENYANSMPEGLSAGQRRRLDLARALAIQPDFLLVDEPVGDLDTSTMNLLLPLLRGINRDHETTILMMTALQRVASSAKRQVALNPPVHGVMTMIETQIPQQSLEA
ncbi:MAG TPA: ATP-binding cassette domain-containing protein [Candidatus Binatus sp.]|nr:ATP-binding cassette domain-containing protein [Candidatus Binatus sp.]